MLVVSSFLFFSASCAAQTIRARRGAAAISMLAVIVGVAFLNFPSSRSSYSGSPWP
jgi:heme/copper-type cytochrome/quinol oxidase subunit 3